MKVAKGRKTVAKGVFAALYVFMASLSVIAADYTWKGGTGNWTDASKWETTASGYPSSSDAEVKFSADANVTLDTGAQTDVAYINVTAGNVVLTATEGSSIKINWLGYNNPSGKTGNRGIMVSEGATLDLAAPLAQFSGRVDRQGTGRLIVRNITVSKQDAASWYVFNGTNEFVGTAFVNQPNADFTVGLGTPHDKSFVFIKDSARITSRLFSTSAGGNPVPNTKIVQDGAETVVSVSGNLDLRNNSGNDGHCYTLRSGTLSASELKISPNNNAAANYAPEHFHYIQEGGTSTFTKVTLTKGSAALRGGVMNIPTLSAITTDGGCALNLEGGTLALSAETLSTWDWSEPKFDYAPGASVAIVGSSSLSISRSCSTYGLGLEIGEGKTVQVASGATVTAPRNSTNVWKVTINNGSVLRLASATARIFVPLDLSVNGTGKVNMYSSSGGYGGGSRSTVVAHRLVVDGIEKAKGRHTATSSDFLDAGTVGSVKNAASILVPTVWTGAGGDSLWSNPANWDNNTVPNGTAAIADVSRAESVTLDQDVTLNALVAIPNGIERRVTITGSGTITLHSSASYQCNIFLPEGCELVLDANLTRDTSNIHGVFGGGRLTVKKVFPGCTSALVPYMAIDGTLAFAGSTASVANIPTSNYAFLSLWTYESGVGRVLFENGTTFTASRLWNGENSYVPPYEFRQTGGTITLSTFYLNNGNNVGNQTAGAPFYYLEGGALTVPAVLNLGRSLGPSDSRKRFPGGSFEMSGGSFSCNGFNGGCNQNYVNLYGGDLYLSGNLAASFNPVVVGGKETVVQTNKNDYTYYFGGVTIRPTGAQRNLDSGNAYLTGKNGDVKFDLSERDFGFSPGNTVSGPGGIVVSGGSGRKLYSAADFTFTGAITVKSGGIYFYEASTVNGPSALIVENADSSAYFGNGAAKAFDRIVLAQASNLSVGQNKTVTTKRLVVGGADVAAGTYTGVYGSGTVVVTGSAPASWVEDGAGDLSWFADGTTTTVDAAITLFSLTYVPATAGETNAIAGAALTFADGANIHVERGDTLVINNDVVFAGKVTKTGWGEVVFNGAVTSAVTPAADTDNYWLTVTEGGATFDGAVTGVRLVTCGAIDGQGVPVITLKENCTVSNYGIVLTAWNEGSTACCGETHQQGATVDYSTTIFDDLISNKSNWALTQPRSGGYGRYVLDSGEFRGHNSFHMSFVFASSVNHLGSFEFVQNGGTFIEPKNIMFSRVTSGVKFTYTLNGGRFEFGGYLAAFADPTLNILKLNGGTYVANASDAIKRESFTLNTSGTVTFEVAAGKTLTIADDGTDAVSFAKTGDGSLSFDGVLDIAGLDVQGGTVTLTDKVLQMLDGTAGLSIARGATLNLDYDGEATFRTLTVGRSRASGVYSATRGSSAVKRVLGGDGELKILEGSDPGVFIMIR